MIRDVRYYENRIELMKGRVRENNNIIKKFERKIRQLKREGK